jgi:2-keto-4-pentenoate hydratase/2-oxohepta-3-ene-1,7-dioic acid hydratase in catechol pathway
MKLATFTSDGSTRIGVVVDDSIVDLSRAAPGLPTDMVRFLEAGQRAIDTARECSREGKGIALKNVRLEAPVLRPRKFLCHGGSWAPQPQLSLRGEILEKINELKRSINHQFDMAGMRAQGHQLWANKQVTCVNGPYDPITIPKISEQVIPETELAVVIGKVCRRLTTQEASGAIAGYMVCNDVTTVDWSQISPTVTLGKSFDTHGPIGPWVVTPDEVGDPHSLQLRTYIGGEELASANTSSMLVSCFDMVAYLSHVMTLEPGDILSTGTSALPARFLKEGDVVRCEIERIGYIENALIKEE